MHEKLLQLDPSRIDFSKAAVLLNRSKRFVLPVPLLPDGGEELRYPQGHEKAGKAIYENSEGSPQRGIVFANQTDATWQGVQGNGKEAIVINDLTAEQASLLRLKIMEVAPDIRQITADQVQSILAFAREELGVVDMFDKDLESIGKQMRFVDASAKPPVQGDPATFLGFMEVSKDTEHRAVRMERGFCLQGPVLQQYPKGAIIVTDGNCIWGLDKEVCKRNWVIKNWAGNEEPIRSLESDVPEYKL